MVYNSVGGGTGSGFCNRLLERLSVDYGKQPKVGINLYPDNLPEAFFESYNAILATHQLLEHTDVNIPLENGALQDICREHLDINQPTYSTMNKIASQFISAIGASIRKYYDIATLIKDTVPYPRIQYLTTSFSPYIKRCSDLTPTVGPTSNQMVNQAFSPSNTMIRCNPLSGTYMSITLAYRGEGFIPKEVNILTSMIKRKLKIVDWATAGLRLNLIRETGQFLTNSELS